MNAANDPALGSAAPEGAAQPDAAATPAPAPIWRPETLRWLHALGLAPLYVRRALLPSAAPAVATPAPPRRGYAAAAQSSVAMAPPPSADEQLTPPPRPPASPREQAIAAMDWEELRAATDACRACKLGHMRHRAVFGAGSVQARWMIVGEAPGAEEDRQGEPFVGAAGQLLDQMLASIGLSRSSENPQQAVFIANVLKCRPPANRNPLPDEVAACAPILRRQIELLRPRIILALGRFAAQTLLGSDAPISQLRGQVHDYAGVPTIVSYHPAYLLRNPADKARAWRDLCLACDTLVDPPAD